METLSHWAKSLKSGDKCLATIRHQTDGSKNLINQELTVVHNGELKDSLIGKLNDGAVLRVPYNELTEIKTETLYRKVAVSERKPIKSGTYSSNEEEVYYRESTKKFEHNYDAHCVYPQWWLEEIPDPTAQLKADKAELLEALESIKPALRYFPEKLDEIKSLIQKHK